MKKATEPVKEQEAKHAVILDEEVMEKVKVIVGEIPTKYGLALMEIFHARTFEVKQQDKE
jgi:ribosomal protein S25